MKPMLKILSTIWLSIVLATVPLQALTAVVAVADADPCQMHTVDGDSVMADEGCPNCDDHNCNSEDCNHQGCASFHIQPAKLTQLHSLPVMHPAAPAMMTAANHSSRSTPPLLKPPA
jgi:hypothetical protein